MRRLSAAALALALLATVSHAQTTTTPGTTPTVSDPATGSFAKLSPGNQRIATAIFEAQKAEQETLTLDQIAHRKLHDRQGWGVIYRDLQQRGLVSEKNVGQAMKAFNDRHPAVMTAGAAGVGPSVGRDLVRGGGPGGPSGSTGGHGLGPGGNPGRGHGAGHGKH
jgi:hypothetical protein